MRIYISGAITGHEATAAEKFSLAARVVEACGYTPINPMEILPPDPSLEWADYMAADIAVLLRCDGIVMLPCWHGSRGARIELAIAKELDLWVNFWDENWQEIAKREMAKQAETRPVGSVSSALEYIDEDAKASLFQYF